MVVFCFEIMAMRMGICIKTKCLEGFCGMMICNVCVNDNFFLVLNVIQKRKAMK